MGVAQLVQIVAYSTQKAPARWHFAGFDSPALDTRFDETPPQSVGAILLPIQVASGIAVEDAAAQERAFLATIEKRYLDQGITARDLTRMVAEDFLADLTVGAVRERADEDIPEGSRGTVFTVQVTRTVNNDCVPIETPP